MKTPSLPALSVGLTVSLVGVAIYLLGSPPPALPSVPAPTAQTTSASIPFTAGRTDESSRAKDSSPAFSNRSTATSPQFPPPSALAGDASPRLAQTAVNSLPPATGNSDNPSTDAGAAVSAPLDPDAQSVNGTMPGNSLNFRGVRVAIAGVYPADTSGSALAVDVTPASGAAGVAPGGSGLTLASSTTAAGSGGIDSGAAPVVPGSQPATPTGSIGGQPSASPGAAPTVGGQADGLTTGDELFRMKWGWAAFDAARTEARREAERKRAAQ